MSISVTCLIDDSDYSVSVDKRPQGYFIGMYNENTGEDIGAVIPAHEMADVLTMILKAVGIEQQAHAVVRFELT